MQTSGKKILTISVGSHLAREAGESTLVEIVVQESAGMSHLCPTLFQGGRLSKGPLRYFPN